ncbi:MAG: hypothetical protein LV480_14370 [Methylacidiphilales bacterium]|nr:hypothetical protein [Candidatus Methylacidiphilales bacterium]
MINFTRAFDSAWERMHVILFRPFDFGKWCAIGFSAFLAGFLQGGNGINGSFNNGNFNNNAFTKSSGQTPNIDWHQFHSSIANAFTGMQVGIICAIVILIGVFTLAFILLMYWLGARGQFMFLDNIVRNRGAIAWPWQNYSRLGNSLFGFYLLFLLISFAIFIPILIAAAVMCIPLFTQHRWPVGGEIAGFVILGLLYFGLAIVMGFILFVFREFGVPIMFRQGLLARPAFWASMKLISRHTGSVVVFVLLRMAIFIGVAILSILICCATCCIGTLPYIGTVILLPVLVYVRCFTLDCLAQFGPEYDVWIVDVPPASSLEGQPPA